MPPYDDWNVIDDEEEDELQDLSMFEGKKDVVLFCIDCSESMQELREDPNYEDVQTCHLFTALEAAMQIQKKKIVVGPNDHAGILLFNTTRKSDLTREQGSEIKKNTFIYQPISPLSAPKVKELMQLLEDFREDPTALRKEFPPLEGGRVPMGDVFTSCNWVMRDSAPQTSTKRVFLITDEDDPHPGVGSQQLITSARTTLIDLSQAGVNLEPFFITTEEKTFDISKFYSSVLLPNNVIDEDEIDSANPSVLPESISIARVEDLLAQMRFREVPKRAQFSIPFKLGDGFSIGIKGYGLVTEQKKGSYKYFVDLGDRMEAASSRTVYLDEARQVEIPSSRAVYGGSLGAPLKDDPTDEEGVTSIRQVKMGQKPFYSAEELKSFRTLGLTPGIKLLGFKDRTELAFEDNIKHSMFIYPDEMAFSGSKRTFNALLKSLVKKKKIGLVLTLTRRNASPTFCALLPQEERTDDSGFMIDPPGFHLIPLPFADDVRSAGVTTGARASDELREAARAWVDKLAIKNGAYPPDSHPNPALAYHNAQLEASAFREEFDPDLFEDLTLPKEEMIHKRAGKLMKEWKNLLQQDEAGNVVDAPPEKAKSKATGTKRKAEEQEPDISDDTEVRSLYEEGNLGKLRVPELKAFLKSKGLSVSGRKDDLVERAAEWLSTH